MKALLLQTYGRLGHVDVPAPAPAADEVLVRVRACGICGSDVHGLDGSTGRRRPPLIMGHEAAGEIAALGPGVTGWGIGERVTFDSTLWCGRCPHCLRGEVNLCDHREVLGVSPGEYRRHGAYAEYTTVPARVLYRLPDALPFHVAAFAEPVSVALHAVGLAGVRAGQSAAVVGAGMIGALVIQALRQAGCAPIIALDLAADRLAFALRHGATHGVPADAPDAVERVRALTNGGGVDAAFEVVGATAPLRTAIAAAAKGGAVVLVGNVAPSVELPLQSVVARQLRLLGSCASAGEYPAALKALATGAIDVAPLLSARAPLAEGPRWFERLRAGEPGLMKVVLEP